MMLSITCRAAHTPTRCSSSDQADRHQLPPTSKPSPPLTRRTAFVAATTTLTSLAAGLYLTPSSQADTLADTAIDQGFPPLNTTTTTSNSNEFSEQQQQSQPADTTITDKIYFDIGLCPEAVRANRNLGDKSILCNDPQSLGRIVIGLYGKQAPNTVNIIKAVVANGSYNGSIFSKVVPGQYISAGKQGSRRSGFVQPPAGLPSNPDLLSSSAFKLLHQRPGTVSLNLSLNEDEDEIRYGFEYRNTSFLITTGPGPVPSLDGENIVFGQVLEGLDVVAEVATVPIFYPNSNIRAFNDFGRLIGDDRAQKTQAKWGRPLKAVVIVNSGVL